eukprot:scaffold379_cov235-Pinguiococcus_pyrenoidosus.AAC.12
MLRGLYFFVFLALAVANSALDVAAENGVRVGALGGPPSLGAGAAAESWGFLMTPSPLPPSKILLESEGHVVVAVLHDAFFPVVLLALNASLLHWYDYFRVMPTSLTRRRMLLRLGRGLGVLTVVDALFAAFFICMLLLIMGAVIGTNSFRVAAYVAIAYLAMNAGVSLPQHIWILRLSSHFLRTIPRRDMKYLHTSNSLVSNKGPIVLLKKGEKREDR